MKFEGFRIGKTNGWKPKIGGLYVASLKLTASFHLKMYGWKTNVFSFLERPIFQLANCFLPGKVNVFGPSIFGKKPHEVFK